MTFQFFILTRFVESETEIIFFPFEASSVFKDFE